jgi:2,4-dienoyl-CoA reductase-like NADH-dependent reductase (Old Yellow Enzyme family)
VAVPRSLIVGVKVNAADYVNGGLTEDQALGHIRQISEWDMVDSIEISGGDYETPDFSRAANPRQAFFAKFSRLAVRILPHGGDYPVIMLTGSLVSNGGCHRRGFDS